MNDLDPVQCPTCSGHGTIPRVVAEIRSDPEAMAGIARGIADMKAGRMTPWSELKREMMDCDDGALADMERVEAELDAEEQTECIPSATAPVPTP